ncbi:unnamed protein product, partial [marine sediment metagenome]
IANEIKLRKRLAKGNAICHSTIMFRNEGENYYREKFIYSQDYDFYLMLLSEGERLINIQDILTKYRITPNAISWNEGKDVKQKLFALKARDFYHQRVQCGKDLYNEFNPNEILNLDLENSTDKVVLFSKVRFSFRRNNFKETREICRRYFRCYGYLNMILLYYLSTSLGKSVVNFIRKMKSITAT